MFGLGKSRTKLGEFLDRNKLTQEKVRTAAGIDRVIMGELCGNVNYNPQSKTRIKLVGALRRVGFDVDMKDFW